MAIWSLNPPAADTIMIRPLMPETAPPLTGPSALTCGQAPRRLPVGSLYGEVKCEKLGESFYGMCFLLLVTTKEPPFIPPALH
ncbi:hypothetical protein AAU61_12805 [Desulfocarbo indianensis]|nr:hypothetical protein AAU61_12805 [Desulfocarbo indianensis]